MAKARIKFTGEYTSRDYETSKDSRTVNFYQDTRRGKKYLTKRRGFTSTTVESGSTGQGIAAWIGATNTYTTPAIITAFNKTNSNIYQGPATVYVGAITGGCTGITETSISGTATITISSSDSTAWYTDDNAIDTTTYTGDTHASTTIDGIASTTGMVVGQQISGIGIPIGATIATIIGANSITISDTATTTATTTLYVYQNVFTGDITNTSAVVINVSSTTGLLVGQSLTGAGIQAGTRILTIDSSTQITMTLPATATTATLPITRSILAKIIDADFPGNAGFTLAGTFSHMDGYAFIMTTDSKLWASDLNSISAWTATSYDTANSTPDRGIGCVRHKNNILAFGTASFEVFFNAGLTPFPLAKIPQQTTLLGISGTNNKVRPHNSITQISDTIFFAAKSPEGSLSLFKYDGGVQKLSDIDWYIDVNIGARFISVSSARLWGKTFIFVSAATSTKYYIVEENTWHEFATAAASSSLPCSQFASIESSAGTINYSVDMDRTVGSPPGKLYIWHPSTSTFTDDTATLTGTLISEREDHGTTKNKFYSSATLIADKESSTSAVTLYYSDDDYGTWTTHGTTFDVSENLPQVTRLGRGNNRAWKLTTTAATPLRIEALELEVDIGQ